VRSITLRYKFIRSICRLRILLEKIILLRGCVRIERQRLLAWSLLIENFRRAMSFSNRRTNLSLSMYALIYSAQTAQRIKNKE
jgi:hypothetical protein